MNELEVINIYDVREDRSILTNIELTCVLINITDNIENSSKFYEFNSNTLKAQTNTFAILFLKKIYLHLK